MMLTLAMRESLLQTSRHAAMKAYCPYSKFRVGAAVLCGEQIIGGCNVENASYGLTICAERNAIFAAIMAGYCRIDAVAISLPDVQSGAELALSTPCGACRQVIAEFADDATPIYIDGIADMTLSQLLPLAFRLPKSS